MKLKFLAALVIIIILALILGYRHLHRQSRSSPARHFSPPAELVPFHTPGGTLQTGGFSRTETLHKETSTRLGTTSSSIRLTANYRYEIELRGQWNILIDDTRKVAFVVAPTFKPQLPVAVDTLSLHESTSSGWGRFNKWQQLQSLRQDISPTLEALAASIGYMEVARNQARITVEEFVSDWLLKNRGWPENSEHFVKVYFADEANIPFPENKSLKDFLP